MNEQDDDRRDDGTDQGDDERSDQASGPLADDAAHDDDWFWWTDGERSRPVSHVPERPDLPAAGGPPTLSDPGPWSHAREGWAWSPPPAPEPRRPRGSAIVAAIVAASLLIASGVGIGWGLSQGDGGSSSAIASPPTTGAAGDGGSTTGGSTGGQVPPQGQVGGTTRQVAQSVKPAVVVIRTEIGTGAPGSFAQGSAAGTGMLITSSGEVLTNNHVIRGATGIEVTIQDEGTFPAEVVGADPTDDVALLQVQGVSGLPTITRDTSNLSVGMAVVAIGNAYGQGSASATAGRITGLEQTITAGDPGSAPEQLSGLIQTNAAIAPGDSGGALVDTQGEVVGMITAASQTSAFTRTSTQGYAIAIDDALGIVNRIQSGQATGDIVLGRPGLLGVQVRNLDNAAAARLGLATDGGAFIVEVVPETPAADAGMTAGSAITSINGHAIGSADDLGNVMHTTKPGEQATVEWMSNDGPHSATVELITAPAV